MDDAELLRELRENCQCFQRPAFADPPCAICKAASRIESLSTEIERLKAENAELLRQRDALATVANAFGNLLERT